MTMGLSSVFLRRLLLLCLSILPFVSAVGTSHQQIAHLPATASRETPCFGLDTLVDRSIPWFLSCFLLTCLGVRVQVHTCKRSVHIQTLLTLLRCLLLQLNSSLQNGADCLTPDGLFSSAWRGNGELLGRAPFDGLLATIVANTPPAPAPAASLSENSSHPIRARKRSWQVFTHFCTDCRHTKCCNFRVCVYYGGGFAPPLFTRALAV